MNMVEHNPVTNLYPFMVDEAAVETIDLNTGTLHYLLRRKNHHPVVDTIAISSIILNSRSYC